MTLSIDSDRNSQDPPDQPAAEGSADDNRTVLKVAIGLAVVALVLGVLAVVTTRSDNTTPDWRGRVLTEPEAIPDITLSDTGGADFNLISDTPGDLTLLMFGYTNCPDICPISLGTLNAALDDLGPDVANRIDMVFVTADPQRDTPERLREYLDGYNSDFIGLRGTAQQITEAQDLANVPRAELGDPDEDGDYPVGHATQIIAYQSDGEARIAYPFGTRAEDWKLDLPRLLDGEVPSQ